MSINVDNVVPNEFTLMDPVTASASVLRRSLMEVPASNQTSFTTGNQIKFNISGNNVFFDADNSYIKLNIRITPGANNATPSLDVIGVHSLFKHVEIRSIGGMQIQKYENYNRWVAVQQALGEGPGGTNFNSSVSNLTQGCNINELVAPVPNTAPLTNAAYRGSAVEPAFGVTTSTTILPTRQVLSESTDEGFNGTVICKLQCSFLKHMVPLFLMKNGIEVIIDLEDAEIAFCHGTLIVEGGNTLTYTITEPKYMCMFVTPHDDIVSEYIARWKSQEGLILNIPSVRTIQATRDPSTQNDNVSFNFGVRSGRKVYVTVQDNTCANAKSVSAKISYSLSTFIRSKITEYQSRVGAHEFPTRPVRVDDLGIEALHQLKMVCGRDDLNIPHYRWISNNVIRTTNADNLLLAGFYSYESLSFIMGFDLSRHDGFGQELCGTDLSLVPFDLRLSRYGSYNLASGNHVFRTGLAGNAHTTLPGQMLYNAFCVHDAMLRIQMSGNTVLK